MDNIRLFLVSHAPEFNEIGLYFKTKQATFNFFYKGRFFLNATDFLSAKRELRLQGYNLNDNPDWSCTLEIPLPFNGQLNVKVNINNYTIIGFTVDGRVENELKIRAKTAILNYTKRKLKNFLDGN